MSTNLFCSLMLVQFYNLTECLVDVIHAQCFVSCRYTCLTYWKITSMAQDPYICLDPGLGCGMLYPQPSLSRGVLGHDWVYVCTVARVTALQAFPRVTRIIWYAR